MHSGSAFESQQKQHRRVLSLSSSVASDRDDDLTLFREMQRREREYKPSIPEQPGMQTPRTGPKPLDQSLHRVPASSTPIKSYGADDLLSSDWGKNDYDWLMTPPGTPLFLPVDCDPINSDVSCVGTASVRSALKPSKLGNSKSEPPSRAEHQSKSVRGNLGLQQPLNVNSIGSASSLIPAKPVLSGVPRSSTQGFNPAVRHSVPSLRHAPVGAISSSRLSSSIATTGMPQGTLQNGGPHTSTPSSRAGVPNGRSACPSRPSTPLKRSPSHPCNPPTTLVRCASANRASSLLSKGSRPCSPTSKAWFPEALHGFSQDQPPNLRTSMPERSLSNSRSSTSKAFQVEQSDTGVRSRQQSSSSVVARGPTSTASQNGGKAAHMNAKLGCNAAEMLASNGSASKLGVKVMREKKPTMCSQEGQSLVLEPHVKKPARSTPLRDVKSIFSSMCESSALGRNPSKKSLDLTLRRMDICKGTPQKIRSFMSSMSKPRALVDQGVKGSGNNGNHSTSSVMDSPMATSSSASSEQNMSIVIDPEGSEIGDESISEKGSRSSAASQHDLFLLGKEKRISSWLRSPDYRDDDADIMQIFEQEGLESLSGPESPLISDLNGTIECDNFCLDPIKQL